ncbi:hypothetical protein [Nonomuraea indica]|uniref:Uncharacterized protein n=1 Tax=Nonomuraea indica TaxID=1581193 RepID=A0ABW8A7M3_9ACTN
MNLAVPVLLGYVLVAVAALPLITTSVSFLGRPWPAGPLWLVPACVLLVGVVVWLATVLPAGRAYATGG